jgi:hypothetical protein
MEVADIDDDRFFRFRTMVCAKPLAAAKPARRGADGAFLAAAIIHADDVLA